MNRPPGPEWKGAASNPNGSVPQSAARCYPPAMSRKSPRLARPVLIAPIYPRRGARAWCALDRVPVDQPTRSPRSSPWHCNTASTPAIGRRPTLGPWPIPPATASASPPGPTAPARRHPLRRLNQRLLPRSPDLARRSRKIARPGQMEGEKQHAARPLCRAEVKQATMRLDRTPRRRSATTAPVRGRRRRRHAGRSASRPRPRTDPVGPAVGWLRPPGPARALSRSLGARRRAIRR